MISLLIVGYFVVAITRTVSVGATTGIALVRGKEPPLVREDGDGPVRALVRTAVRAGLDDFATRRTANAQLRAEKAQRTADRRLDRYRARQMKRTGRTGTGGELDVPDWLKGGTPNDTGPSPSGPDRPAEPGPDPSPQPGPDRSGPDRTGPDDNQPSAGPAVTPPSKPDRPPLRLVPPLPEILEAMPDMTTPVPSGEIPTIPQLRDFLTGLEAHIESLRNATGNALRVLTAPAESGGHGVTDPAMTGILGQIIQALGSAKAACPTGRTALQPHIAAANALHGTRGPGTRTASYTGTPAPSPTPTPSPEPAGV